MKILKWVICGWGICGVVYFTMDTILNEERWSREEDSWFAYVAAGPAVWAVYVCVIVVCRVLSWLT